MKYSGAALVAATLILSFSTAGAAALGERIFTVSGQSKAQVSNLKITQKNSSVGTPYSVQESEEGGIKMKQFVSSDGVVFAVAWKGIAPPDFNDILGKYYSDYSAETQSVLRPRNRKKLNVKSQDFVFRNSSLGGSFRGLAYVPSLLPAGLAVEDLQ